MFIPKRVIFEEEALEYSSGKDLLQKFKKEDVEIKYIKGSRATGIPGRNPMEAYTEGKSTLVVGIRKTLKFETCRPSADYAIPLVSGCMGMCEYCYLNTRMGKKPYIKVHVNIDDVLDRAGEYAEARLPQITTFEGSATSDPVPVEPYTGALQKAIEYFGRNEHTLFRFVTKYTDIDSLLKLDHNGRTTIRFSLNTEDVIRKFEHRTPSLIERINAAYKVQQSDYSIGFIIAPVFLSESWKADYLDLIYKLSKLFSSGNVKFEVISHRFTKSAKGNIMDVYPKTVLPMEEEMRKFKFGQFGYGKYVYRDEELSEMKDFFTTNLEQHFGENSISYII